MNILYPFYIPQANVWRTPLRLIPPDQYKLWVDKDYVRVFTKDTLPDEIKRKLALIHANNDDYDDTYENYMAKFLRAPHDIGELIDVGWRCGNNFYCVVLSSQTISSLRGEPVDDTRGQGQSKSQEDS